MIEKIVADRIKSCRERSNETLEQVGDIAGVHKSTVMRWERGETSRISTATIETLAQHFHVSPAWLAGKNVPMTSEHSSLFDPIPSTYKIPRLGLISCGDPLMSEENFDGYDDVPSSIRCDFSLVCEGDSMTGARINDGDIVYIKQQSTIENGEIAAILIDGEEKLLKRVYVTNSSITLQAENPAYPPRIYIGNEMNRVSIIGKAVAFTSLIR